MAGEAKGTQVEVAQTTSQPHTALRSLPPRVRSLRLQDHRLWLQDPNLRLQGRDLHSQDVIFARKIAIFTCKIDQKCRPKQLQRAAKSIFPQQNRGFDLVITLKA